MDCKYLVVSGKFADFVSSIEDVREKVIASGLTCSVYKRCGNGRVSLGYEYFCDMSFEELE